MDRKKKLEWWETFFKGTWKYVQISSHAPVRTKKEVDFVEDVLKLKKGNKILDVPCGDGRLTVELAARGYKMSGIDNSDYILKQAKLKTKRKNVSIEWHRSDMRKIPWKNKFDAAICMWGSFGYFDEKGDELFIQAVSSALKPKGKFLLDAHITETLLPMYEPKGWNKIGDITVLEDRYFDYETGRVEVDWTFLWKGEQKTYHSSIRIYSYREIVTLLKNYGFKKFEVYGSLDKEPFRVGSRRIYLVAIK